MRLAANRMSRTTVPSPALLSTTISTTGRCPRGRERGVVGRTGCPRVRRALERAWARAHCQPACRAYSPLHCRAGDAIKVLTVSYGARPMLGFPRPTARRTGQIRLLEGQESPSADLDMPPSFHRAIAVVPLPSLWSHGVSLPARSAGAELLRHGTRLVSLSVLCVSAPISPGPAKSAINRRRQSG